jgi:hypothetical protein
MNDRHYINYSIIVPSFNQELVEFSSSIKLDFHGKLK